jgi:hypothetical protein
MADVWDQFADAPEAPTVKRRGLIVPRDEMSDGTTQWAWPSALAEPYEAVNRLLRGELPVMHPDEMTNADAAERLGAGLSAAGAAMGGSMLATRPAASLGAGGRKILPQDVLTWLKQAGVPAHKFEARTGTEYVAFKDPNVPKGVTPPVPTERPVVRIPKDDHSGRPATDAQVANRFDTAPPHKSFWRFSAPTENRGGGSYSDLENLVAALKWRTARSPDGQWLIRPDQEPRGARYSGQPKPDAPPEGPDLTPDQLKLLGSLAPAELLELLRQAGVE